MMCNDITSLYQRHYNMPLQAQSVRFIKNNSREWVTWHALISQLAPFQHNPCFSTLYLNIKGFLKIVCIYSLEKPILEPHIFKAAALFMSFSLKEHLVLWWHTLTKKKNIYKWLYWSSKFEWKIQHEKVCQPSYWWRKQRKWKERKVGKKKLNPKITKTLR